MSSTLSKEKDIHADCIWQSRDEMDEPTNPLQALTESYCRQSKDMATLKFDAWCYGIIVGWDDAAYEELSVDHNWSKGQVAYNKMLHQNYINAWQLYIQSKQKQK